tara:strand:+ start:1360 stop:1797 length:438 start_codon:yes stop_codon:yes gene_type:complete
MIRGKSKRCPYGMPIPYGCMNAGDSASIMLEISKDDSEELSEKKMMHNWDLLMQLDEGSACKYADALIKSRDNDEVQAVDCKHGEDAQGMPAGNSGINGSSLHPHWFIGDMYQPLKGMPLDYISDDNQYKEYFGSIYTDMINSII